MDGTFWIVAAIVVVAIVIAVALATRSRTRLMDSHRAEAAALRDDTAEHNRALRENEAAAAATAAQARRAQAEADLRAAEAKQLEVDVQRANESLTAAKQTHEEQLRKADALDPDVETDRDGSRPLDDELSQSRPDRSA